MSLEQPEPTSAQKRPTGSGVGASVRRKEDDRLMRGRGRFVGDMRFPGQLEAAFVRSTVAHGHIRAINIPPHLAGRAFCHADMVGVKDILAKTALPGFRVSSQPALARDKVRFVGELVVMVLAETRAEAEDLCEEIEVDYAELAANHDMLRAAGPGAAAIHEHWPDNVFLVSATGLELDASLADAPVKVTREIQTSRQCMAPLEGKGCIANFERHVEQLTLWTSTQMPHIVRTGLSEVLGIDHRKIRVVAPDVGGGFGWKGLLQPEEVCCAWAALTLDRPVKWLEDRREHLIAAANCREHHYVMTAYADASGKLLGLDAVAHVDAGAYSVYPFSACLEGAQVVSNLPGPYDIGAYRCRTLSVCSNKPPIVPYRGVARTGVCTAIELMIDAVARAVGKEPFAVRLANLVKPERMPFRSVTGKMFDMGDYPESLRRAHAMIEHDAVRDRQRASEPDGRRIGIGYATYCEQGAHGTSVYHGWGIPMVPGFEQCAARLTPDGTLEVRVGNQSHGQSMETTLAQIACELLGLDLDHVNVVHGDTALTPYSTGTWGSRSAVMAGGAVAAACDKLGGRLKTIGAYLLQTTPDAVFIKDATVSTGAAAVSFREIAATWYLKPQNLPPDIDPEGLDLVAGYRPMVDTGTFSYATHAVVVAVTVETGTVEILDYVVVEDGGVLLNPMVVEGQIHGGLAQGIGTALYEEMRYDSNGQPLASTLADYLIPGANDVPAARIAHLETPSPNTRFGQKGIGEGGAIAPPAAIGNAVNDALASLGVELTIFPLTPERLREAIAAGGVLKAAKFEYLRPADVKEAVDALGTAGAKPLSGGQSLGAMLNLRLARPALLVDIGRLPELRAVEARTDGVMFGAGLTHAEFEDAVVPDPTGGVLASVARAIGYRAVRNRGTIGGSLCHADPAADWPTTLAALGGSVRIMGPSGTRQMPIEAFIVGAFETALQPQEIVTGVFVPRLSKGRRWGYVKSCRKVGEFAEALAAILCDPDRGVRRMVVGALDARAILIGDAAEALRDASAVDDILAGAGLTNDRPRYGLHRAVVARSMAALDADEARA